MARTAKREDLFHWVGPLVGKRWVLFAKNGSGIKIDTLNDASKFIIGIMRNDARSVYLKDKGFQNIFEATEHVQALTMLMKGRVDLWASSDFEGPIIIKETEHKFSDLEIVFNMKRVQSYLGISKSTSPEIAKQWQNAFAEMKQDGTIEKIAAKWAKILDIPITGTKGIITFTDY
jgi:polar amino acid transport system substrate-binding protein